MNSKTWLKIFVSLSFLCTLSIVIINIKFLDSYGIFKKDYLNLNSEINQNFVKMEFLLKGKHNFDSFIFGSSRVGKINPKLIPSNKYYNMTYSEGLPLEHLSNIKLLLKNNLKIKNILIGLDDFSYQVEPQKHLKELIRKPHYLTDLNNENIFEFYSKYFLKRPSLIVLKNIFKNESSKIDFDVYNTGLPIVPKNIEVYIENNIKKHINDKKFKKPTHYSGNRIYKTINEIKEIISLSKEKNFNLVIFINPIHITTYLDTNFKNFNIFKKELARITNFYDFSGINKITTNNYFYYETSHYRTIVADMIIKRIFPKDINSSNTFGKIITSKNIDKHLIFLESQIKNY